MGDKVFNWGHSLESLLSCWPVKSAKEMSSLSLYVWVISLPENVSVTLKH